jgi:3-oxoacyl-(acyl-carrier-protein) synthase
MNDFSETNAVKAVFQERAWQIPMSSTKGQMGHLISAAGAVEGAIAAMTIEKGCVPMTRNRTTPDPECDLDYVVEGPREKSVGVSMSNSFGFGGTNSSVVFKHPDLDCA